MTLRTALKDLTPPLLWRAAGSIVYGRQRLRFDGDYASWEQARRDSTGYDSDAIAGRVLEAALKVRRGEAVDERDGVAFGEPQYSYPMLAALARFRLAARAGPHVIDVGGAFGRYYRHFKTFFGSPVNWSVVELPNIAALGEEHFANNELRFFASFGEALARGPADAVVLASVLQYFEKPYALVDQLLECKPSHFVIDRTPCSSAARDTLTVQHVPATIYPAAYPCWIFSRTRLLAAFGDGYVPVVEFAECSGPWQAPRGPFEMKGWLLERKSTKVGP
jgi:putative methyltransferase (TIGR04325 family)